MKDEDGLTPKMQRFVEEYLVDLNATQAAIRAGYSEKTARAIGSENLSKPVIQLAIEEAQAKRSERTQITADQVLSELALIAKSDIRDLMEWDEERSCFVPSRDLSREQAAAISEIQAETTRFTRDDDVVETRVKLKVKVWDKLRALGDIAKHLGMFTDRMMTIDPKDLSDAELERVAAGEDPLKVLASRRTNQTDDDDSGTSLD